MKKLLILLTLLTMSITSFAQARKVKFVLVESRDQCLEITEFHGNRVIDPEDCPNIVAGELFKVKRTDLIALKIDLTQYKCDFTIQDNNYSDSRDSNSGKNDDSSYTCHACGICGD